MRAVGSRAAGPPPRGHPGEREDLARGTSPPSGHLAERVELDGGACPPPGHPGRREDLPRGTSPPRHAARAYMDPHLAGLGIGVVLLLAFVIMGRGLGASGAFSSVVAAGASAVAPAHASASEAYAPYLLEGGPLRDWLVIEIAGVALGALASALLARRLRVGLERGPGAGRVARVVAAFAGGLCMGLGAKLARGCTSGQALTGGALLGAGSWLFILTTFGAGYLAAPFMRRLWR